MNKMPKLAFSTLACPTWPFERLARPDYHGVEIRQVAGETDLLKVPEFQPARRAASLACIKRMPAGDPSNPTPFAVCGLASSVRFDYPDQAQRKEQLEIGQGYVELAAELEAGFVRVFGDVLPNAYYVAERAATLAQIADGLNRLGEFASRYKVEILLETHGDFARSPQVKELFRQVESPSVGVLWDTHHPWRFFHEAPEITLANLQPWLRHTHWKDSIASPNMPGAGHGSPANAEAAAAQALMSGHRHADYMLFGGGEFPIDRFVRVLKQAGYDGWLCLEWEKMWHPELADPEIALPLFPEKMRFYWEHASA